MIRLLTVLQCITIFGLFGFVGGADCGGSLRVALLGVIGAVLLLIGLQLVKEYLLLYRIERKRRKVRLKGVVYYE